MDLFNKQENKQESIQENQYTSEFEYWKKEGIKKANKIIQQTTHKQ